VRLLACLFDLEGGSKGPRSCRILESFGTMRETMAGKCAGAPGAHTSWD